MIGAPLLGPAVHAVGLSPYWSWGRAACHACHEPITGACLSLAALMNHNALPSQLIERTLVRLTPFTSSPTELLSSFLSLFFLGPVPIRDFPTWSTARTRVPLLCFY